MEYLVSMKDNDNLVKQSFFFFFFAGIHRDAYIASQDSTTESVDNFLLSHFPEIFTSMTIKRRVFVRVRLGLRLRLGLRVKLERGLGQGYS